MTKEELCEYRDLQKEIKRLQIRINRLKDVNHGVVADIVKGSSKEFPYTQHPIHIEGFNGEKKQSSISKVHKLLSQRIDKSMNKTVKIAEFICNIDSVKVRTIFEYRYYDLLTFQQISNRMGWQDESTSREVHDKYLNSLIIPRTPPKES